MRTVTVFSFLLASVAAAQSTPPPASPFAPPLAGYVGRYLDSAQTPEPPNDYRLNAGTIRIVPDWDLILMNLGGKRLGAYRLRHFADLVAAGSFATGPNGEKYLLPDRFIVDPQAAGSGWIAPPAGSHEVLSDFDVDDRGNTYLALSVGGFGIVDRNGVKQSQVFPPGLNPHRIVALRDGAKVFVVVSDMSKTAVYDVTNPSVPAFVRFLPFGVAAHAKLMSGGVAIIEVFLEELRIYPTAVDLLTGSSPAQTFRPPPGLSYPVFMATDGTAIFTLPSTPPGPSYLSVMTPSGGGQYQETLYPTIPGLLPFDMTYGAGFVTVTGIAFRATFPSAGVLYRLDPFAQFDLSEYFSTAYQAPPGSGIGPASLAPFSDGTQVYLIAGLSFIGDLFTLPQPPPIPATSSISLFGLGMAIALIALISLIGARAGRRPSIPHRSPISST
ncbi:MAG TPA: hypothetical protein VJZ76_21925 [Thermoanaerobaculia bacterium]|nr:hypothetical protein [Thermoanaerobaculia bacterium]